MAQSSGVSRFPQVGDGSGLARDASFNREEVQLALRNKGMPLEGLRYPVTPTGMHYLLVHFDIPYVDVGGWHLDMGGLVSKPLRLTLEEIKARPAVTIPITMECAGNGRALLCPRPISQPWLVEGVGTAYWTGTPLHSLLEEAEVQGGAVEVVFTGRDRGLQGDVVHYYQRSLPIKDALRDELLLVYGMNGEELQPQHGYPLRLLVPGWYGMASVKWLDRIEVVTNIFQGYQVAQTYRYTQSAEDPGEAVSLVKVRALMIPPGIPDFLTRMRLVKAGPVTLQGRAWAGRLDVARVEVSSDGGRSWAESSLSKQPAPYTWQDWSFQWHAEPGRHTLCVRATDSQGNAQPVEQPWNYQGMGNNMVQRVDVVVEEQV